MLKFDKVINKRIKYVFGRVSGGFTLAEILVTLSVIGIIASITIPSLMQDIQDSQLKVAWKKAYSDLEQAAKMVLMNNGGNLTSLFADSKDMRNEFSESFSYTKACDSASIDGCWHLANKSQKLNNVLVGASTNPALILNNGSLVLFELTNSACNGSSGSIVNKCANLSVDINGFKSPNKYGKDIFRVHVIKDGVKPFGSQGDYWVANNYTCLGGNTSVLNTGDVCSALYLYKD